MIAKVEKQLAEWSNGAGAADPSGFKRRECRLRKRDDELGCDADIDAELDGNGGGDG